MGVFDVVDEVLLPRVSTGAEVVGVDDPLGDGAVGSPVPDCDWTSAMSKLLIAPFTVTSSRKLSAVTGCPDWD